MQAQTPEVSGEKASTTSQHDPLWTHTKALQGGAQ